MLSTISRIQQLHTPGSTCLWNIWIVQNFKNKKKYFNNKKRMPEKLHRYIQDLIVSRKTDRTNKTWIPGKKLKNQQQPFLCFSVFSQWKKLRTWSSSKYQKSNVCTCCFLNFPVNCEALNALCTRNAFLIFDYYPMNDRLYFIYQFCIGAFFIA